MKTISNVVIVLFIITYIRLFITLHTTSGNFELNINLFAGILQFLWSYLNKNK